MPFPPGFVWGLATSAYQIEGAVADGGRGESIWDRFSHNPGAVENGDTGDTACDHYHRWREDVELLAELEAPAYRFSVAWPRIQPDGTGPANRRGVDFYSRLVDVLLANGIRPVVTLYHFDLPETLEQRGGWTARDTVYLYRDYTAIVFEALGDRVDMWITHNEPFAQAALGYISGSFPPGRSDDVDGFVAASHHLLLSHGLAVAAYRDLGLAAPVGATLGLGPTYPEHRRRPDEDAARIWDGLENLWFLAPLLSAAYPEEAASVLAGAGASFEAFRDGDLSVIASPIDFLGVNYYTHRVVRADPDEMFGCGIVPTGLRTTEMGWEIVPEGLFDLLTRLSGLAPGLPLYITENGAAFVDRPGPGGEFDDQDRISFLRDHIRVCEQAIGAGVDLRGYFVWSFLDNFEWHLGYRPRFGIVHVDRQSQQRKPKASARFFRSVVHANGLPSSQSPS